MKGIASRVRLTKIGKYHVLEKIGKGGQGTVYKGQDPVTGELVAIKVMPPEVASDPVLGLRFAQECQVARKLNHPHIVRVLEYGLDGIKPYLVMEHVDGETLGDRLEREGRIPAAEAVRLTVQIGEALDYAHQHRLVHRDIKPDNILVTTDGQAKLADLGLAKNLEGDFNLTQPLSCLGTPNFMAPEQFEDAKKADTRCDLYSLAATLYMAITGELPFRSRSTHAVGAIYKKKIANMISPPSQFVAGLDEGLDLAILQALRADPKERQASIKEFVTELQSVSEAVAKELSGTLSEDERRRKRRYSSRRETRCHPLERDPHMSWAGKIVNISETGMCLALNRRFEPGALLKVDLEGQDLRRDTVIVRVQWVKKDSTDTWHLGCKYDQPLCDFEVKALR